MAKHTALFDEHINDGAHMIDFGGWKMPVNYGSQIKEHHAVRKSAGMFDVSHMTIIDLDGDRATHFLQRLLANDVVKLKTAGKALYSCMLNDQGGIIDDLIVYFQAPNRYRMVVNAATRDKDLAWISNQASNFNVRITERDDLAMIAVQGPAARDKVHGLLDDDLRGIVDSLKPFHSASNERLFIGRTGYTGEDGYEIMLPNSMAADYWSRLRETDVVPSGLGARDTLRLEAGFCLYGSDMDESTSPLESGLTWTVAWTPEERDFIGREPIEHQQQVGADRVQVGLVLEGKGILRSHQKVYVDGLGEGEISSGSFAPTLGISIALARVPAGTQGHIEVDIRGRRQSVRVVKPPFVRHGKSCID